MSIRFPRALKRGDLIAVIAPSSGVQEGMHGRLSQAIGLLEDAGFRVREGNSLRHQAKGASARATERATELMDALLDPDVAAVIPPWGGELAIELLPLLDFDRLANAAPKWLSGFSDLSTIQVPLLVRSGWASLHGPNLMQLPEPALDPTTARIFDAWRCEFGSKLHQQESSMTPWRLLNDSCRSLRFEGRLIGGCVDSISRLSGTPYGALPAFSSSHSDDGVIVFLENAELRAFEFARALHGLRLAGWFEEVSGVLFGRDAAAGSNHASFTSHDAIDSALGDLPCPVILDVDIGHVGPQWSLVQGAKGVVEWSNGKGSLDQCLI
jgi:muramoyltetrapeptide carboxypeptidase LdcA involved in peptidoglycan recycling